MLVYLNGAILDRSAATISLDDRGFLFGDGVYEVLRAVDGAFIEPERHMRRLVRSAREIRLALDDTRAAELLDASSTLLERNGHASGQALVYIEVTRGAAPRRHAFPPAGTPPTVYLTTRPFTPLEEEKRRGVAVITHPDQRWARCDIKSVNLLPNVMANQLAHERGAYEAIFVRDGLLTEGTHTSVFGVIGGELRTHPLTNRILPSITRDVVLELASDAGVEIREVPLSTIELGRVDELFLAGTTADVMPVIAVDGKPVRGGAPGPLTRRLAAAYEAQLRSPVPQRVR